MTSTTENCAHTIRRADGSWVQRLVQAVALQSQRTQLGRLPAEALADIGVAKSDAQREAKRPIWDAPNQWRKR